jgi:DNA-binding response OmpR family regulator
MISTAVMDVLLVEDDEQLRDGIRRVFERKGHRCDGVATGGEALTAITSRTYDLVVLDWGLPDIEGPELVERVRAARRTVPILMLTGRSENEDLVRALDAGADDFVRKSEAQPEVLLARAEALARRAKYPPVPRRIEAGALVIDEATRSATLAGTSLDLAPTEVKVLGLLAAQPGNVVSRADLIAACWGEGVAVSDNALESVMKRLRKKLGSEGDRLQSVRLRGYVLAVRATTSTTP